MTQHILILVGSLRAGSFNRQVAHYIQANAPADMIFEMGEIGDLPLYNQDFDEASPPSYERLRGQIRAADGIVFVTPEHNRGMPAAMKNVIDIGSRPAGQSVWNGKPCAVLSASPSSIGGMGANLQLRQSLVVLGAPCLPVEGYLHSIHNAFNPEGELISEHVQNSLAKFISALQEWVARFQTSTQ